MRELAPNKQALDRLLEQPGHQVYNTSKGKEEKMPIQCPIDNISDEECYALASITPLLGVSDNCIRDSKAYLEDLFRDYHLYMGIFLKASETNYDCLITVQRDWAHLLDFEIQIMYST